MLKSSTLVALSSLCAFALAAPAYAKVTPEQKCASFKMKVVGKRLAAEAKCYAKALAASAVVDPACLSAAATKFADAFTKADDGDCLHVSDSGPIGTKIDEAIDDIAGDIGCGDGAEQGDEQCDDDNTNGGDGCSSTCSVEPGFSCTGQPAVCTPDTPPDDCVADYFPCAIDADCCTVGATCVAAGLPEPRCLPPTP